MDAKSSALDITARESLEVPQTSSRVKQRLFRTKPQDSLPLTLKHERIYILPSARGMAFIGVIAIMLLASINYGLNLGYALCFILIGLFSSTLLATFKNLVNLKIIAITATDAFQGNPLEYQIEVQNDSRRCKHSVRVSTNQSPGSIDIQAGQSTIACLRINDAQRGVHQLGRLTISSDFPLGIWRGWGYVHAPVTTYVYPKPEHPSPEFAAALTGEQQTTNTQTGEQEYKGLKNYEASDSPSRIAWKQVASGAGWYSKPNSSNHTMPKARSAYTGKTPWHTWMMNSACRA